MTLEFTCYMLILTNVFTLFIMRSDTERLERVTTVLVDAAKGLCSIEAVDNGVKVTYKGDE